MSARLGAIFVVVCLSLACKKEVATSVAAPVQAPAELSVAVTAKRPAAGEYFGLYLMGKKVGYSFQRMSSIPGRPDWVQFDSETHFKAQVGSRISERVMKDTRVYQSVPNGKLVSFRFEQAGDGGDQILEGTATENGLSVVRKRPGLADEKLTLGKALETVEDADQVRVAIARKSNVKGSSLYPLDLQNYGLSSTFHGEEQRMIRGVNVTLSRVTSVSEKEKVPVEALIDSEGRVVEIQFGPTLKAAAETKEVAQSLEQVEVFGLTRVVLPKALPESAKKVPGQVTLLMTGLPKSFQAPNYRQLFRNLDAERVEVTLKAVPPSKADVALPLKNLPTGDYLKNSIVVEADNTEIKALAQKIVGDEKNALAATRKINQWIFKNLKKDYGASADRSTDVLRQMRGDCTEHSLLMTALLRSLGIPARRIDGLIYTVNSDQVPAFYWHEWVEAWVGEWTQLDPTFGQDVAESTHFALGEETNAEITMLLGQIKVLEVR